MFTVVRNYIRYNHGLVGAVKKLSFAVISLLRSQDFAGLIRQWRETRLRMRQIERERRRAEAAHCFHANHVLRILATRHTAFIAYMLHTQFSRFGIATEVVQDLNHRPDNRFLYLVVCPQMFKHMPTHMIAFQMEQSTSDRWFDQKYLDRLQNAVAVLDYSIRNIDYLQKKGLSSSLLYHYKVQPVPAYLDRISHLGITVDLPAEADYDVVFYGDTRCERRKRILAELSKKFRILVLSEVFGADLYSALLKARVVLNIHYYEPALLETTRISECVSLGLPVVSERGFDDEEHETWGGRVSYVPTGDIDAMATAIEAYAHIRKEPPPPYQPSPSTQQAIDLGTARLLVGCGGMLPPSFLASTGPLVSLDAITPVCLSLPETPVRRAYALKHHIGNVQYFDGLRHMQAWRGCALSYWYLSQLAISAHLPWLEIYEDDCEFFPTSAKSLSIARQYLRKQDDPWDVFSALITTLPEDAKILHVDTHEGLTFVHLNCTMGMVYSIFSRSACAHLAAWDYAWDDPALNTIDRYLATKPDLRVITCLPYLVGHQETVDSSLWGFDNQAYAPLIEKSQNRLEQLVQDFVAKNPRHIADS